MSWTAVVPLKGRGERKTRLAGRLDAAARRRLSDWMFDHVVAVLGAIPSIAQIMLLSDHPRPSWNGGFVLDAGRGLNPELDAVAMAIRPKPMLVIHADLPLLATGDVDLLIERAEARGIAIAPDRAGTGTNAIALREPSGFRFGFGTDSFRRHLFAAGGEAAVVERVGLALDIDTPDDLDAAITAGYPLSIPPGS